LLGWPTHFEDSFFIPLSFFSIPRQSVTLPSATGPSVAALTEVDLHDASLTHRNLPLVAIHHHHLHSLTATVGNPATHSLELDISDMVS
jgi:hypothetical protein